jgi:hypothetical protein
MIVRLGMIGILQKYGFSSEDIATRVPGCENTHRGGYFRGLRDAAAAGDGEETSALSALRHAGAVFGHTVSSIHAI